MRPLDADNRYGMTCRRVIAIASIGIVLAGITPYALWALSGMYAFGPDSWRIESESRQHFVWRAEWLGTRVERRVRHIEGVARDAEGRRLHGTSWSREHWTRSWGLPFLSHESVFVLAQDYVWHRGVMSRKSSIDVTPTLLLFLRGFPWSASRGLNEYLPLRPRPVGLIANTVVFMVAAYGADRLWTKLCQTRRRRLGLCATCRYDLGSLGVCPECGRSE